MFSLSLSLLKHDCLITFLTEMCLLTSLLKHVCHLTSLAETCLPFHFPCPRLDGVSQDQFPVGICPSSPFLLSQVLNGQYHSVKYLFSLSLFNSIQFNLFCVHQIQEGSYTQRILNISIRLH